MGSHKNGVEGENHLSHHTGYGFFNADMNMIPSPFSWSLALLSYLLGGHIFFNLHLPISVTVESFLLTLHIPYQIPFQLHFSFPDSIPTHPSSILIFVTVYKSLVPQLIISFLYFSLARSSLITCAGLLSSLPDSSQVGMENTSILRITCLKR